jgi:hypothetical protein
MTGAATTLGETGVGGFGNAIAFDPSDVLFWAQGDSSFTLDQTSGLATFVEDFVYPSDCDVPRISGADFDDGQAFGSLRCGSGVVPTFDDRLVQVDFTTAEITEVGPFTTGGEQLAGLDGLAFRTEPMSPE